MYLVGNWFLFSANHELQSQQEEQEEQKNQPKTILASQSSNRLSICGSINQESDKNQDLAKMVTEEEKSDNERTQSKTDSSDESFIENNKSQVEACAIQGAVIPQTQSMLATESVKLDPMEIPINSANHELQSQQEEQEEQKNQPKTILASQSSNRLSICGSINQEFDKNQDLAKMVTEEENSDNDRRKINLKRKCKTSDESFIEKNNSQEEVLNSKRKTLKASQSIENEKLVHKRLYNKFLQQKKKKKKKRKKRKV